MNEELKRLIEGNMRTAYEIITFGALPLADADPVDGLVPVVSEEFGTLADLRAYLRGIYTEEETERLLKEGNIGLPQYIEKDGKLFYNLDQMVGGAPSAWKSYTAEPEALPEGAEEVFVTVRVVFDAYLEEGDPEETGTYRLHAVKTPDGWRLARMEDRPEEWMIPEEGGEDGE